VAKKHEVSAPDTVLIIDDDQLNRTALRRSLEKENVSVLDTGYGGDARSIIVNERPGLIFVDLSGVPGDRAAFVAELKDATTTWDIPVLAITETDSPVRRLRKRLGIKRFLSKPLSPRTLARLIYEDLMFHKLESSGD